MAEGEAMSAMEHFEPGCCGVLCQHIYESIRCMPNVHGGLKKSSDALEFA